MNEHEVPGPVTRDVVVDLLPAYLAGEASADTVALVKRFLERDPELAERVDAVTSYDLNMLALPAPAAGGELAALAQARRLLALQRWMFGLALGFTAITFSLHITWGPSQPTRVSLGLLEYPGVLAVVVLAAAGSWVAYAALRRRTRMILR